MSETCQMIRKWLPVTCVAAGVVAVGGVALGLAEKSKHIEVDAAQVPHLTEEQADQLASVVLANKCAACHGSNPTYSTLLNIGSLGLMARHVAGAQRSFTLEPDESVRPALTNVLKMDYTLAARRMPPISYTMAHWGSALTEGDVALLRRVFATEQAQTAITPIEPAAEPTDAVAAAKIQLGHLLFNDPRLSTNNRVACASCHTLTKGGTDNLPKSEGVPGADGKPQLGGVNAPTVFNAEKRIRQFWDGRAADLKEQAGGPPLNPVEMGYEHPEDWAKIAAKLQQDPELVALFGYVYPQGGITGDTITDAIAAYEKTLVTPDSAFDRYLKGDAEALTPQQKAGYEAFRSHGCITCHSGSTMGGASFEYINTFADLREAAAPASYEESAYGLFDFTKKEQHRDMFRVPTLRNVALTKPYFHTGSVQSLEEAVRIMFKTQCDRSVSAETVQAVAAFLEAQTGKLNGKPLNELTAQDVAPQHKPLPTVAGE
ncbi:MAG: cytochrome c peroxidase [Akkermansia sp.]